METVDGLTDRCKIYNKMVQMLESKSVRETVGQHWKDWVCQKDTRLANARDLAKDRGLTRAEVTFYCKDRVPSDNLMEDTLLRITEYVPPAIVYSTPFGETWRAYCDSMLHSLVVIDRTRDVGLIVYTYNEMTKNISGQFVESWADKEKWCLGNLTLGSTLPLDVIEVCDRSKAMSTKSKTKTYDVHVDISGVRYFKNRKDGNADFTTRLVSKGGVYSWDILDVKIPESSCRKKHKATDSKRKQQWKEVAREAASDIQESRKPFEDAITEKWNKLSLLNNYSNAFSNNKIIHLKDLPLGSYNVMAMRETQTQFGDFAIPISTSKHTYAETCRTPRRRR
ncbi:Hypothetical predicted protein [Paramuricea clavata]|uniref:Uncharacterized protein n=1 Tax=Paramuricea clavata TaxID=317549 RepID=A0A6S7J7C4_PARCT|nr:Hypothetical predicted protein [Paramuricea clavata]